MLTTPYGRILLVLDGTSLPYAAVPIEDARHFPDVDGAVRFEYDFVPDGGEHELCCVLEQAPVSGDIESGERLEALSFWIGQGKLTIGCEGCFLLFGRVWL